MNVLAPWRTPNRLFRSASYVALGLPVGVATFTISITIVALSIGLMPAFLIGVPVAWVGSFVVRGVAQLERSRASLVGAPIPDSVVASTRTGWWARTVDRARSAARWRELGHMFAVFPVSLAGYVAVTVSWCGSLALVLLPVYADELPDQSAKFGLFDLQADNNWRFVASAIGVVGAVLVAPWVTIGAARVQVSLARYLLAPTGTEELAVEVDELQTSRVAAVDSAEAERRRIERDLHDGAQQRLVALAASLGAARDRLETDPEAGRVMVAAAHEESKAALREIRDLIRGIHPAILQDRGIDAALSAVVARTSVPVTIDVDLRERPPAAVETTAYFIVTEALTNVDRHSDATHARVSIGRSADRLVVEIYDNGRGGADASRGSGLDGLRERVASMRGSMHVISPPGGPTTISVELPCGS